MVMENVVYFLGAGFSAPLGLPVMSNFLEKSKDQFAADPSSYGHFGEVFDTINKLDHVLKFFNTNVFNIEDILSILEMVDAVGSLEGMTEPPSKSFQRYICDVIEYHTPPLPSQQTWESGGLWNRYCKFTSVLLNYAFQQVGPGGPAFKTHRLSKSEAQYGVISLNYDLVLENAEEHFHSFGKAPGFRRVPPRGESEDGQGVPLVKLHGSIDTRSIIPPTWNKTLERKDVNVVPSWREAYSLIRRANHIRIIGYSLPETDAYVKYLLRAAVIESTHLKRIDVLCLDPDGSVKTRYDQFVQHPSYRFASQTTEVYLAHVAGPNASTDEGVRVAEGLESRHDFFFQQQAQ